MFFFLSSLVCGVLLRYFCFLFIDFETWETRPELVSPIYNYERMRESILVDEKLAEFTQNPLVLLLVAPFISSKSLMFFLGAILDIAVALCLYAISYRYGVDSGSIKEVENDVKEEDEANINSSSTDTQIVEILRKQPFLSPAGIASVYFFNPWVWASNVVLSLQNLTFLFFLLAVATGKSKKLAALFTALGIYLTPNAGPVFLLGIGAYSFEQRHEEKIEEDEISRPPSESEQFAGLKGSYGRFEFSAVKDFLKDFTSFTMLTSCFFILILLMVGDPAEYYKFAVALSLHKEISSSLGLGWYVFTAMFERFRMGYVAIYNLHFLTYPLPFFLHINYQAIKGRKKGAASRKCAALHSLVGYFSIFAIFRTHPTAADFAVVLPLLFTPSDIVKRCQHQLILLICVGFFGISMYPVMSVMWLVRNTGNANFLFFMGIVYNVGFCGASLMWLQSENAWRREMVDPPKKLKEQDVGEAEEKNMEAVK